MLIVQMPIMFYVFTKGQKQITMYVYIQISFHIITGSFKVNKKSLNIIIFI